MTSDAFGILLKQHRKQRRYSQLDLASEAEISSRHLSFLETGRSKPSREMILHLGRVLDMPMREVNLMLASAGFAQVYGALSLDDPEMSAARDALQLMLGSHEPFPAVVLDDHWNILMANQAQQKFALMLMAEGAVFPASTCLLDQFFAPGGYREFVEEWESFAVYLLQRVEKELLLTGDVEGAAVIVDRLTSYPGVPADWRQRTVIYEGSPMLQLNLNVKGKPLALFSTIAVFGTPLDATLQGLRIEHYFPADDTTRQFFADS